MSKNNVNTVVKVNENEINININNIEVIKKYVKEHENVLINIFIIGYN